MKLEKFDIESEFYTDEGCYIVEILNNPELDNLSIARARVEKGVKNCRSLPD